MISDSTTKSKFTSILTSIRFRTTNSYLLIIAGQDKIVDNKAAMEFHKHSGTPKEQKNLKQFFKACHTIHKESNYKSDYYETIYKYISKTL